MNISSKKLIVFDLDGTLAPSKSPLEADMAQLIIKILAAKKVAIISGGGFPQFQHQLLVQMPLTNDRYSHLYLLPASGTQLYSWKGSWIQEYCESLSLHERERITSSLNAALRGAGYSEPEKTYGPVTEDRTSQITFSALGQQAPLELKIKWDPDHTKRTKIVSLLKKRLPEYDCRIGGMTSIDITKKGVNKGYGLHKLEHFLKIPIADMVFVGDSLFHGGNDFPAKATGIDCVAVQDPMETKKLITAWVQ
jgi:phosphomannomutase